ncbi:MAG TPA: hypothetical protein DCP32_10660 [Anaerolineaceae bacterium]|nr:hypothetical protein [Anaerolineaceae bacterium]HBA90454.1 hypothetical protein [Anaerolineaceae bacterium]
MASQISADCFDLSEVSQRQKLSPRQATNPGLAKSDLTRKKSGKSDLTGENQRAILISSE